MPISAMASASHSHWGQSAEPTMFSKDGHCRFGQERHAILLFLPDHWLRWSLITRQFAQLAWLAT